MRNLVLILGITLFAFSCGSGNRPKPQAFGPPITDQYIVGQWTQYKGVSVIGRDTSVITSDGDRYYDFRAEGKIGFPMQDLDFDWRIDTKKNEVQIGMLSESGALQWINYKARVINDSTFLTMQEHLGEQHIYYFRKGWPED